MEKIANLRNMFICTFLLLYFSNGHSNSMNTCLIDSDCRLINSGNCCGQDDAVSKDYFLKLNRPMPERCKLEKHYCPSIQVKCVGKTCLKINLDEKRRNCLNMAHHTWQLTPDGTYDCITEPFER